VSVRHMHVYDCGFSCNCMKFCDDLGGLADRMAGYAVRKRETVLS
jgi:hypothetical protein